VTPARRAACTQGSFQAVDHVLLGGPATAWFSPGSFAELPRGIEAEAVQLSDLCPLVIELKLPPG